MEEVRIDLSNRIKLSLKVLLALDCRSGNILVVKYGSKCIEVRKKEKE